jgi:hypothetical protein
MNDALIVEIRGYQIVEKRIFTVTHAALPSRSG